MLQYVALIPFIAVVGAIAICPLVMPQHWENSWSRSAILTGIAVPMVVIELLAGHGAEITDSIAEYVHFIVILLALFIISAGLEVRVDHAPNPRTNSRLMLVGAVLASIVGTMGAAMVLIRPLLELNRGRRRRHLVLFFILIVGNAGGLLTPMGDPPLLLGFLMGVPFWWPFVHLLPYWVITVAWLVGVGYLVDRWCWRHDQHLARDEPAGKVTIDGWPHLWAMGVVIGSFVLMPSHGSLAWVRDVIILVVVWVSWARRPHHRRIDLNPMWEVAIVYAALFATMAPALRMVRAWGDVHETTPTTLYWATGILSSVLDNGPTYVAMTAMSPSVSPELPLGIATQALVAVSLGAVIFGALTYIGNGPNLVVRAIAESEGVPMPTFFGYCVRAVVVLAPVLALNGWLATWTWEREG